MHVEKKYHQISLKTLKQVTHARQLTISKLIKVQRSPFKIYLKFYTPFFKRYIVLLGVLQFNSYSFAFKS